MKINEVTGSVQSFDANTGKAVIKTPTGEQDVDASKLTPNAQGQLELDTPKVSAGQSVNINTQATSEASGQPPYFVDMSSGKPMAKTGGIAGQGAMTAIIPSTKWTAITPDIEAKAQQQGFRVVSIQGNGGVVKGLEGGDQKLGSKIIVAPNDYQALSAVQHEARDTIAQGGGDIGGDATDEFIKDVTDKKFTRANRPNGNNGTASPVPKLKETDELYKWLTIAGLK
jgi:hypothetical protein